MSFEFITLKDASFLTGRTIQAIRKKLKTSNLQSKKVLVKNRSTIHIFTDSLLQHYPDKKEEINKYITDGVILSKYKGNTITDINDINADLNLKENEGIKSNIIANVDTNTGNTITDKEVLRDSESYYKDVLIDSLNKRINGLEDQNKALLDIISKKDKQIDLLIQSKEHSDILLKGFSSQLKIESKEQKKKRSLIEMLFYK